MAIIMPMWGTPGADTIAPPGGFYWYIWAGGGNDTILGADNGNNIHGEDGDDRIVGGTSSDVLYGDAGNDSISGGADWGYDSLFGGSGADLLSGNGGDDRLDGGSGNDRLDGGANYDTLLGGTGSDRFMFGSVNDSPLNNPWGPYGMDRILDFERGIDRIDLSAIDANVGLAGNQAFRFIGWNPLSDAGQIRAEPVNNNMGEGWLLSFSVERNVYLPEMQIFVAGTGALTASDFIL